MPIKNKSYSFPLKLLIALFNMFKILLIWLLRKYEKSGYSWLLRSEENMNIKKATKHYITKSPKNTLSDFQFYYNN